MLNDKFEFEKFLDSPEFDQGEYALYAMARRGFIAGWRAAGGHVMAGQGIMKTETKYDVPRRERTTGDVVEFPKL